MVVECENEEEKKVKRERGNSIKIREKNEWQGEKKTKKEWSRYKGKKEVWKVKKKKKWHKKKRWKIMEIERRVEKIEGNKIKNIESRKRGSNLEKNR